MEQNKNQLIEMVANILHVLQSKYPYSVEFAKEIKPDDKYFLDSCNFVDLLFELHELEITLRNMVRYSDMSECAFKNATSSKHNLKYEEKDDEI